MAVRKRTDTTTKEKVDQYELLTPLLSAMLSDFHELAKKKADGVVSTSKVKMVNRLLADVYKLLQDEPSRPYLDLLDEDDLPQNSDVMLVLGQAKAALLAFRERYYGYDGVAHKWFTT